MSAATRQPMTRHGRLSAALQHCCMTTPLPVSKRGSLTLPPTLRRKLGLDKLKHPMVIVEEKQGGLFIQPAAAVPVRDTPKGTIAKWIATDEADMKQLKAARKKPSRR